MKKIINMVCGLLALIFGLNFTAHAKTDFQTKLEKYIKVEAKDKGVQPICDEKCPKGNAK